MPLFVTVQRLAPVALLVGTLACGEPAHAAKGGELTIKVVDRDNQAPLACRMHLKNTHKRLPKLPKVAAWHDHFAIPGEITLKLPPGTYTFELERGPEYLVRTGHFVIQDYAEDTEVIDMKRVVDMAAEGWWSGDLHVERPLDEIELLMQADDLHVAQLVAPGKSKPSRGKASRGAKNLEPGLLQFGDDRFCQTLAAIDERAGGSLLLLNLAKPLDAAGLGPEFPPQIERIADAAGEPWVDSAQATAWDLPMLIANGQIDSIALADRRLARSAILDSETGGKPRDKGRYPGPTGIPRWSEEVYYHVLNCGLRIPPTAHSGSGLAPNPVGYNRLYVHLDGALTYDKWWQGLRAGRVVVTNGPLIRPTVEGELPGHVFRADAGQEIELEIGLTLSTRERIDYLEVVKNGHVAYEVRLDALAKRGGRMPKLKFDDSGWFLIRAIADNRATFRFASTGPYYVEMGYRPRVSKRSAQFFLDWVNERAGKLETEDARERKQVLKYHRTARDFFQKLVAEANAE